MLVYRSTVAAAIFAGALLVGCTAPDQPTDLRTDGPPNITAVMVMSDLRTPSDPSPPRLGGRLYESATFCRASDEKRPGLVGLPDVTTMQVCPEDLTKDVADSGKVEGAPPNWFARVVFDQLLDPTVEDLVDQLDAMMKPTGTKLGTIATTQPVTLQCTNAAGTLVDVPYGGYYVPNGNSISWPLGPALFVQPTSAVSVPVGATCQVGVKDMVHNKAGDQVASDQRSKKFEFKIAPMDLRFSDPDPEDGKDGAIEVSPKSPVRFFWTAALQATPTVTDIQIFEGPNLNAGADPDPAVCGTGGTQVLATDILATRNGAGAATTSLIMNLAVKDPASATHLWKENTTYRVQFGPNAKVTPNQGGADGTFPTGYKLCFHTTTVM
jgi:hypothetical protein